MMGNFVRDVLEGISAVTRTEMNSSPYFVAVTRTEMNGSPYLVAVTRTEMNSSPYLVCFDFPVLQQFCISTSPN